MLRLRSSILAHLLSFPATSPGSSGHRLLSAAAPLIPPNPIFVLEDYLVETCGLTRAQALKARGKIPQLKSPANSDAVLAFLAGLGLSSADIAVAVAKDPRLLCAKVEKTLASNVAGLTGIGLSSSEVARFVLLAPDKFRVASIVSKLQYYLLLLGSYENVLRVLKSSSYLLSSNLDRVVKPNVALLQECGLGACDIAKLCISLRWLLTANVERVRRMVVCAEGIGVPRGSGMFRAALHSVAFLGEDEIAAKMDYLKNTFRQWRSCSQAMGWSDAEVRIAVCKAPKVLMRSKDMLQRASEFLFFEVGLESAYIAHRPAILTNSLERRLRPRYYVMKFLKENGLVGCGWSYFSIVNLGEKVFMEKFICPHKEAAPYLAEDYAIACRGEVPTRFGFV